MPGITALTKTQIGAEATAGTGNPTTIWRGMGSLKDRREIVFPPERVGIFGGTNRSYTPRTGGEILLTGDATYDQMPYIFNAGVANVTPTTDTGSGYIRTWTVAKTSADLFATTDIATLAVEIGDNQEVNKVNYCFLKELTLTGKQGEGMQVSALFEGRSPTTSASFTAVASTDYENPAETILFSKVAMAIDVSTDTPGTTSKIETILDFSLKFKTGWVAFPARDGRTDFSSIKRIDDEITLDITFEHNAISQAERDAWKAETERLIQLKFTGTTLSVGGVYTAKTFLMNLWGKWKVFGAEGLEEDNGDNVYKGSFHCGYSALGANKAVFIICTDTQNLP